MRLNERLPGHSFSALGRGLQAVLVEDPLDGVAADDVAEIAERIAQPRVAPARVLGGELDHHRLNRFCRGRPAGTALGGAIVFGGDELAVPAQDGVRRQQVCHFAEHSSPKHLAPDGEPTPLVIGEPKSTAVKLLAQNPVLLLEVVDQLDLLPVDPAGEQQEQELQRLAAHVQASYRADSRPSRSNITPWPTCNI